MEMYTAGETQTGSARDCAARVPSRQNHCERFPISYQFREGAKALE